MLYFKLYLLKLMVNLSTSRRHGEGNALIVPEGTALRRHLVAAGRPHLHQRLAHLQLVEDVLLDAGRRRRGQRHDGHFGKLLPELVHPLVVWPEVMAPL